MLQTVDPTLKRIGNFLKARREKLGADLQDVQTATSIQISFLQAIEEGNIETLISGAYARGFIKQYAAFLGIDGERVLRESSASFGQSQGDFQYGIGSVERRKTIGSSSRLFNRIIVAAAIITIGALLWQFLKNFGAA